MKKLIISIVAISATLFIAPLSVFAEKQTVQESKNEKSVVPAKLVATAASPGGPTAPNTTEKEVPAAAPLPIPPIAPATINGLGTASSIFRITCPDSRGDIALSKDNAVAIDIKNDSDKAVPLTHIGSGMAAVLFALPSPVNLAPGETYHTSALLTMKPEGIFSISVVAASAVGGQFVASAANFMVAPIDRVVINTGWTTWPEKNMDPHVFNIGYKPEGVAISGVRAPKGWNASLEENKITVKPETDNAERGTVEVLSGDKVVASIYVSVMTMPVPMKVPTPPPPADKPSSVPSPQAQVPEKK